MSNIMPCVWFDSNAEAAVDYYLEVFRGGKILNREYYTKSTEAVSGKKAGTLLTIEFEILGYRVLALNGGNEMPNNGAVSLMVMCKNQAEIDYYWDKLSDDGQVIECGWLKDRFGTMWQVASLQWRDAFQAAAPEKKERMMAALLKMKKLDIEKLLNA